MRDLFGQAILDYQTNNSPENIITETSISEADEKSLFENAADTDIINDTRNNTHSNNTTTHTTTYSRDNNATYSKNNPKIEVHSSVDAHIEEPSNARSNVGNEAKTKGKPLNILVVDRQTSKPISEATTVYLNLNDLSISDVILCNNGKQGQFVKYDGTFDLDLVVSKLQNKQTNVSGKAQIKTDKNGNYVINVAKKGYFTEQITLKQGDLRDYVVVLLNQSGNQSGNQLQGQSSNQSRGQSLRNITLHEGHSFKLNNVYYDYDNAIIRVDAARDLDALYVLMMKYPDMEVELSAHTDARGTPAYNLDLSQRRAESAVQYLVRKGIDGQRITAIGYGESQLKNHCVSGFFCSDNEHKINRRTEVKITKSGSAEGQIFTE